MTGRAADGRGATWLALGTSAGTLVCCALPSLLVLLGFGTTVAAAVSSAPWLVAPSTHKEWVFLASGAMIVGSRLYARHVAPRAVPDGAVCPLPLSRLTNAIWWTSVALWAVGAFVAFVLGPLLTWLDG